MRHDEGRPHTVLDYDRRNREGFVAEKMFSGLAVTPSGWRLLAFRYQRFVGISHPSIGSQQPR